MIIQTKQNKVITNVSKDILKVLTRNYKWGGKKN